MEKYIFGVDLGGTTVKMGLFQADGEVLDKWEIPTRTEGHGENILPDIADSIVEKAAQKKKKERKNDRISYKSYARQGKRKQTV